jgi:protein-tyrosine-phosphatase
VSEGEAPRSVLFACTHNIIRSPIAGALARLRFGPIMLVESVGVRPGEAIDPLAAVVMDELGADLAKHRPMGLEALVEDEPAPFDLIITLSPEAHHRVLDLIPQLGKAAEYWPTFDPSLAEGSREQRLMEYRMVRDGLDKRIAARFPRPSTG